MNILQTQEWQAIADAIEKKKEKILKQILCVESELNEQKYSARDMLIAQMEILDFVLKKPQEIHNYKLYEQEIQKTS